MQRCGHGQVMHFDNFCFESAKQLGRMQRETTSCGSTTRTACMAILETVGVELAQEYENGKFPECMAPAVDLAAGGL